MPTAFPCEIAENAETKIDAAQQTKDFVSAPNEDAAEPIERAFNAELFPLPLTVFEEYMFLDDSPAYPMDIFRRLHFVGRLDVDAFRRAVERAVARHPLFACRVEKRSRRYVWVPSDAPVAFDAIRREVPGAQIAELSLSANSVNFVQSTPRRSNAETFYNDVQPLRLATESGLRTTVLWDDDGAEVVFQSHHCAADGAGCERFLHDVLCEYAALVGDATTETRPYDVVLETLNRRGKFGLTLKTYFRNYYYTTKSTLRFLFVKARPFCAERRFPARNAASNARRVDLLEASLTVDETRRFFQEAKRRGATVNDLALARFCEALDRSRRRGGLPVRGVDRIAVPVNMRLAEHRDTPACNVVTMAFLDVSARTRNDSARLLREICRQTTEIKRRGQKYFLDLVLKTGRFLAGTFGGDLSFFLTSSRCRATATFSNLGRTFADAAFPRTEDGRVRIGEIVLNSIGNFPPIRANSIVSVGAHTYAGRLSFGLRYDSEYLSPREAAEFLDDLRAFCARISNDEK